VSEPILEVRNLVKQYPSVTAVDGLSLAVPEGVCFGLLGPNGAGKTTTIEIMEGILNATSGEVRYRGAALGQRFREEAGILFQKTALQDFLTVRQSITMFRGLYQHGLDVDEIIRLCALEKLADRDNRKLSGGQQQRLLMAIALVNDPAVLFLDEPTIGLDVHTRDRVIDFVRLMNEEHGTTVVLTTHDLVDIERLCRRVILIDHGRVAFDGTVDRLKAAFRSERVLTVEYDSADTGADRVPLFVTGQALGPGTVTEISPSRVRVLLPSAPSAVPAVLAVVGARCTITDLSIAENSLERVVKQLYAAEDGFEALAAAQGTGS